MLLNVLNARHQTINLYTLHKIIPAIIVVAIDQLSKYLIKSKFILFETQSIIEPFLRFTYIENSGLAFGLSVGNFDWLLFLVTLIISIYILYYLISYDKIIMHEALSLSFILGGAIGNLIDRGFKLFGVFDYGGVIDFIDIGLFSDSWRWYIFNVADLSVSVGITLYIFYSYIYSNLDNIENETA